MPYQHNKKQDRKPTKRTDRPAPRKAKQNVARNTARNEATRERTARERTAASSTQASTSATREFTPNARKSSSANSRERAQPSRDRMRTTSARTASRNQERMPASKHNARNQAGTSKRDSQAQARPRSAQPYSAVQEVRHKFPITIWIAFALIALIAVAFAFSSCTSCSSTESNSEGTLAASDKAAPEGQTITLSFAGDCTLGTDEGFDRSTSFNAKYNEVGDPAYFFANVAGIFAADDATIVNMEGTLTDSTTRADKTFAFKAPREYAEILKAGNVDAASLANNHSRDYGDQSYTDTIETVEAVGIPTFGYDRIAYLDVKGVKVALVGTYELAEGAGIKDEMVNNINAAKEAGAQIIVVFFHWGTERETVPDSVQMELGHAAIDAGATLVVGSHPHVIQGMENYNGHTIVYSLGNFCFGGNKNPSDKDCMIVQQTFTVRGNDVTIDNTNVIPCSISSVSSRNNYQPTPATGDEKERIEAKIKRSSDAIAEMAAGSGSGSNE